jgi:hypothetical protein
MTCMHCDVQHVLALAANLEWPSHLSTSQSSAISDMAVVLWQTLLQLDASFTCCNFLLQLPLVDTCCEY